MAGERTYPILPCPDIDEAVAFYEALGFHRTFRQLRPNPYAVVSRDDITVHLSGIDGFDPATCVCSVIVTVPDADALHADFARGLRERFGRVPSVGVPRMLRPRRKQGTATGFSVVDPGGSWLRFYRAGSDEPDEQDEPGRGLSRVLEVAARQGDSRGDETAALAVLDRGLARHPDAPPVERVQAMLYRVELLVRTGRLTEAVAGMAEVGSVVLSEDDAAVVADELAHTAEVLAAGSGSSG